MQIRNSVHDLLVTYTKPDIETSPYIAAIQSLDGRTPGEKHRDLNGIIRRILENTKEQGDLSEATEFRDIPAAITPLTRTIVGVELKLKDLVVDGLRSDDYAVVDRALSADWFFDGATVSAGAIKKVIMPFVSLRTRGKIIKKLSASLIGHEKKAEGLFRDFVKMYGVEQSLPILIAGSEDFIFREILANKIVLPLKLVRRLYVRYPNVVVKYLQLGNKNNLDNAEDRKVHEININDYDTFLPRLIYNHSKDFVDLYKITPEKQLQLGSTWTEHFLRNSKDVLIREPCIFLKLMPLKAVSKALRKEEFDTMLENLFPGDMKDFDLNEMLDYLEFYPADEKLHLLKTKFEKIYHKNLLDEAAFVKSPKLLKILPANERQTYVRRLLESTDKNSAMFDILMSHLSPIEALPYFKEKMMEKSMEDRIDLFGHMLECCHINNSYEGVLNVVQYYKSKHKNEQNTVLCSFLEQLIQNFDLKRFGENHWAELKSIINHAYIKNELFVSHVQLIEALLESLLNYEMQKTDNTFNTEKVIDLIIDCKFTMSSTNWNVLKDQREKEKECIEKFFQLIPLKYPEEHVYWQDKNNRIYFALTILKTVDDYNERNRLSKAPKKLKRRTGIRDTPVTEWKINIEDYPWILKLTEEFFSKCAIGFVNRKTRLMQLLEKNAPDFYEAKMDKYCPIRNIESGEALRLLRHNPRKIFENWKGYLTDARKQLNLSKSKAARRFVAATRWHQEIPIRFVEKCLQEIGESGSIEVLGILLEPEEFEKIVAGLPTSLDEVDEKEAKKRYETTKSIIKAARFVNPPVTLDVLEPYCSGDYSSMVDGTLASIAYRTPVNRVMDFARKLVNKPVSTRKIGVRLLQRAATKPQLNEFLKESWSHESNQSMCQLEARMIFDAFVKSPNESNWALMRNCINGLSIVDKSALERLSDVAEVDTKYLSNYVDEYLKKIEALSNKGLDSTSRANLVCLIIEALTSKLTECLTDDTCSMILRRYFFDADSIEISRAAQNFAIRSYLLPAEEKFDIRLKSIMDTLTTVMERFDAPHPKKPRFYAANYTIHEFFGDVLTEIACGNCNRERSLTIIDSMLKVFTSILSPWQEPLSYISLNMFKEYLQADSPRDFGVRCARKVSKLVEDFSANEAIIYDVAKILDDFMYSKIYRELKNPELRLSVIEGLIEGDDFYGAVISTKLLNHNEVENYDERYEGMIKALRQKQNSSVQYNLYKHLNRIRYYSNDDV